MHRRPRGCSDAPQKLGPGSHVWLFGFGGVKVQGVALWPARIVDQNEGGAAVQQARKANKILVKSFGDDQYVWAKPQAVRPFTGATEALARAPAKVEPALRAALTKTGSAAVKRGTGAAQTKPAAPVPATSAAPSVQANAAAAPRPAVGVGPELSAYELKRLETMRANQRVLESLGVASASESLRLAVSTPEKKRAVDPSVQAARAQARHERMLEAQANKRSSSRLQAQPSGAAAHPKRYADEVAELEEAEREAAHVRKRARAAGFGRRARSAASEAALSPEERVAIASAYEEASGWLEEMHGYFADKLSDANLRNVMKQATALATGAGVPHTIRANYFRKGQPVTLDEDFVALRIEANRFLRPEDDPGHGWRLDHPIGKMALFQMHLHEARS